MPWRAVSATGDEAGFTPSELKMLQSVQNSTTGLGTTLTTTVRMFVGAMSAAGYAVNNDDSIPDQLRPHVLAVTVWRYLRMFPQLKAMQTEARRKAAEEGESIYEKIVSRQFGALESPTGTDSTTGTWNSENRLIMRTHPVPPPSLQFQMYGNTPLYANPNAPSSMIPTNSPGVPVPPLNVEAQPASGSIVIMWLPAMNATSYNVYRGTGPGQQLVTPLATGVTGTNFKDTNLTQGQLYYYRVSSVNELVESDLSNEANAKPNP